MLPQRALDIVTTPDGRELVLWQRGDVFHITVDREELMASRAHGSEETLARLALAPLAAMPAPRVLVGGLGMGFTLRAALDALGDRRRARVTVAEMFAAVVAWNRGVLGSLAGQPLADPRVHVVEGDVAERLAPAAFDAILLDVDNGPEAFTLERNARLYSPAGVRRLHAALAPGGMLAVWSASDDPPFAARLAANGFAASTHRVPARASGKGGRHVIFVGRRSAAG